ncbi:MAG: purine-nucleoside phosphorylase [Thermodesulfobacteriota bacterium]
MVPAGEERLDAAMAAHRAQVEEAAAFLAERLPVAPEIVIVLGTGLGGLADRIHDPLVLPYAEIPHFPRATVASHAGNLLCGLLAGRRVAALQGRFHFYEGYSTRLLTLPLRVLSRLGPRLLIVANAAGGLNPAFRPGTIMIIRDHLNLLGENPLRGPNIDAWGPRFPDLSRAYAPELVALASRAAATLALTEVSSGVYVAIAGPSLETPAETRFLRLCGADAVGMSTVPEVIVARHAGMAVLGLSVIANVNDPDNLAPILIEDVIAGAQAAESKLVALVEEILTTLPPSPGEPADQESNQHG